MLSAVEDLALLKSAFVHIWCSEKENSCETLSAVNTSHDIKVKFYQSVVRKL